MKTLLIVFAVLLIAGGIVSLFTGGLSFTHTKNDLSVGPVQLSHKSTSTVPIAAIVSVAAILGGTALALVASRFR